MLVLNRHEGSPEFTHYLSYSIIRVESGCKSIGMRLFIFLGSTLAIGGLYLLVQTRSWGVGYAEGWVASNKRQTAKTMEESPLFFATFIAVEYTPKLPGSGSRRRHAGRGGAVPAAAASTAD